eukprot:scaffold961_cov122-Cylindrotheca_fusiformis.AAC.34
MKFASFLLLSSLSAARAFAPTGSHDLSSPPATTTKTTTALSATNRRDILLSAGSAALLVALPQAASAASATPRPMYLTEPTDEFKANEAKAMEFKRQQLLIKKEFTAALEKFVAEDSNEEALIQDLTELKRLVIKTGGLPLGIKKDELFKTIRTKKAKGFWPTPVEIAYQSLISEISFQQSPNLDKDMGSPFQ